MFIGREKEVKVIEETFKSPKKAIAIYGKRRVGKTTLIDNVLKSKDNYLYFECLKDTIEANLNTFIKVCLNKGIDIPLYITFSSFVDVFHYLDSLNKRLYVVIDEYPYLKELNESSKIDSHFQTIIDNYINNIDLVISGSQIKMMESVLKEGNPLFGRFNKVMRLRELSYIEAREFYNTYSIYDSVIMRSVFGGSPFVNQYIDPSLSYEQNIINTILDENSAVYQYADKVLITDVSSELQARRILSYLGNTKRKYKEIEDKLDTKKSGIINRALDSLVELELVRKVQPINDKNNRRKGYYEISDNLLRFYYTYVYQNKSIINDIGAVNYYNNYIKDTILTFVSLRFEDQVKEYFSIMSNKGMRNDILEIGTYYFDDKDNQTNGQFDIALKVKDGYEIYDAKFYKEPIKPSVMKKELDDIERIKEITVTKIGFVSVNGFVNNNLTYKQISGNDLYSLN